MWTPGTERSPPVGIASPWQVHVKEDYEMLQRRGGGKGYLGVSRPGMHGKRIRYFPQ